MSEEITEQEYLEDNIATVAFHLGRPGARLSVQNGDLCGLLVDPGEVLKEVSRRIANYGELVRALQVTRQMIRNQMVEGAVIDIETMQPLGDYIDAHLSQVAPDVGTGKS